MKRVLFTTAAAAAVAWSLPAIAATCQENLRAVTRKAGSDQQYASLSPQLRSEFRKLREAAIIFARHDKEVACQEVVEGMKAMLDNSERTDDQASRDGKKSDERAEKADRSREKSDRAKNE